jgi:membrane fusion protein, heavy metal efflux system
MAHKGARLVTPDRKLSRKAQAAVIGGCLAAFIAAAVLLQNAERPSVPLGATDFSSQSRTAGQAFRPTDQQWAALTFEPVRRHRFQVEFATEGKIAVNEDSATPVFSPYAGRVTALQAKPGDFVQRGQPLFVVEATDTVQGLNDFITALSTMNSARSKLNLAQIVEKRANDLYAGKAVPLKDWQQAQADLAAAENDMRAAETAVEAVRNRLRILGRTEEQITRFQETRQINADTPIPSPISGTVVQRKVGPGQYVNSGASDPVFVIGDLSSVWLMAFVRESDAAKVRVGQRLNFRVLAAPQRDYRAKVDYVAATFDPVSRRLLVRATIDNKDGLLKPEMFAGVTLYSDDGLETLGVPRRAVIYEGEAARVWIARDDGSIEQRQVKLGLTNGDMIQVLDGLTAGERVIVAGSLFIDRAANGS